MDQARHEVAIFAQLIDFIEQFAAAFFSNLRRSQKRRGFGAPLHLLPTTLSTTSVDSPPVLLELAPA
jgi:hypothetical protein